MKRMFARFFVFALLLVPPAVWAESQSVPNVLNYQSFLYDDGGNLLSDGPVDATFKIKGADGTVLFEEHQTLDVVRGAVSALIGNGLNSNNAPTGGIPASILNPDSAKYLEVAVDNYPPVSSLEIVSVPYAVYAENALHVADGSITIENLAEGVVGQLAGRMSTDGLVATRTDLTSLQTTYQSSSGASSIGVSGGLTYSVNTNLQGVLADLDTAIHERQLEANALNTNAVSHANANLPDAHPNGTIPITRLDTDVATQTELDTESATRYVADNNHESRLNTLESGCCGKIRAWGSVSLSAPSSSVGCNISASGGSGVYDVTFLTPLADANYAVSITPQRTSSPTGTENSMWIIQSKTAGGFRISFPGAPLATYFDFVIVK